MIKRIFTLLLVVFAMSATARNITNADGSITINGDTPWVISEADYANTAFKMALRNVEKDWYKVFGLPPVIFHDKPSNTWNGPVIIFGQEANYSKILPSYVPKGKEQFRLTLTNVGKNRALVACGSDSRGSVYGMYTFAEEILGIDPMYIFTDSKAKRQKEITIKKDYNLASKKPTFEYRGWFINDEELHDGMHRDPLGGNVISMEWMDKILESLLRTKGNMIIPESAPYSDATVYDLCDRRGVAITHHHVTPLGLNMMDWPKDVPFSFTQNKEVLMDAWEKAIIPQANKEVVWIVGFRGKSDGAFWHNDPTAPTTDQGRADVISEAIQCQVDLIRKHDKTGTIVAALWNEVGGFYNKGMLKLPEGVCRMFSDDGRGYMRDEKGKYLAEGDGLYYHVMMMMNTQNRTTEGVPPSRFYSELERYIEKGATKYAIINVSGIRPAAMSVQSIAEYLWDADNAYKKDHKKAEYDYLMGWYGKRFGENLAKKLTDLRMNYYNIPYMREKMPNPGRWSGARGEHLMQYLTQEWFMSRNGIMKDLIEGKDIKENAKFAVQHRYANEPTAETEEFFPQLWKATKALEAEIPAEHKDYYQSHFTYQVAVHMYSAQCLRMTNKAIDNYVATRDRNAFADEIIKVVPVLEKIYDEAHKAEYGAWETLYMHARLMDFYKTRLFIKAAYAQIKGEPYTSMYRDYLRGSFWGSAQEYMDFAEGTFPNFYKHTGSGLKVLEDRK